MSEQLQREELEVRQTWDIVISILEVIAPRTSFDIDDGVLIAAKALRNNPEFLTWLENKFAAEGTMPEGAINFTELPDSVKNLLGEDTEENRQQMKRNLGFNVSDVMKLIEIARFLYDMFNKLKANK